MDFKQMGQYKQMFENYKKLDSKLKKTIIRSKEWKFVDESGEEKDQVIIDITGEMKVKDVKICDDSLLDPSRKTELEGLLLASITKAQNKAQEVVAQQTKEILGVDPNDLQSMMWSMWA